MKNKLQSDRDSNRKNFPFAARMMDELREFFPDAKLVWAEEKGKIIGTKPSGDYVQVSG